MSVGKKMNMGFFSILFIIIVVLAILIQQFMQIDAKVDKTINEEVVQLQLGSEIQRAIATQGMFIRAYVLNPSAFNLDRLNHYNELLTSEINQLAAFDNEPELAQFIVELTQANDKIQTSAADAVTAFDSGSQQQALALINDDFSSANAEIYALTVSIQEHQQTKLDEAVASTKNAIVLSTIFSIIAIVLCVAITIGLIYFVKKFITALLKRVMEEAIHIAENDLTTEAYIHDSKDEIGQLSQAFNQMKQNLQAILLTVQDNTNHLSASAQELAASTEEVLATSEDVANRVVTTAEIASHTAIAANECAVLTDEAAVSLLQVSQSTHTLLANAHTMDTHASSGTDSLLQAQSQMATIYDATSNISTLIDKLSEQSKEIGLITNVITDISDQTNLLALNAAIEAARAGVHGQGFAVVADEVKKLAEQSKSSAIQIVELTNEIQHDTKNVEHAVKAGLISVSEGVRIIENAGNAFSNIAQAIHSVNKQVEDIYQASERVSAGSKEMTTSIHEIATGAEKSTSDFEMIAAAAEQQSATMAQLTDVSVDLSQNAQNLQLVVQKFKI